MATAFAVFSAIGADRVGIVDELSGEIARCGGNIEESKMAVLGGEFAVMMLLSLESSALEALRGRLAAMESRLQLKIGLVPTREPSPAAGGRPYVLETVSLDGYGIVHAISSLLHRMGINIEDMETDTQAAPLTGAPLFRLKASIILSPTQSAAALRRELESLEMERDLDVSLRPLIAAGAD